MLILFICTYVFDARENPDSVLNYFPQNLEIKKISVTIPDFFFVKEREIKDIEWCKGHRERVITDQVSREAISLQKLPNILAEWTQVEVRIFFFSMHKFGK